MGLNSSEKLIEEPDSCPSDCESVISGSENEQRSRVGLIRIHEDEMIYKSIEKKLVNKNNTRVEGIYRNDYSNVMSRARFQSFCVYSKAVEIKNGGNANVKYGWYGGSKDDVDRVIRYGFGFNPGYGHGLHLSPVDHPMESLRTTIPDEDGLRYMLLCRVILGNAEAIHPGSAQCCPSTEEFDSGVDDLVSPTKYVVWTSCMNTHILPEFVISFRASSYCKGCCSSPRHRRRLPNSDWMPFATLIAALSKFLPCDAIETISKHHGDYKKQKITRHEMVLRVREITGDKLLMAIIKSYRRKV